MALISIALTALGFTIAWRMESTHGFHAIMSVFLLPMWLLSGAFFPGGGSGWLAWVITPQPAHLRRRGAAPLFALCPNSEPGA